MLCRQGTFTNPTANLRFAVGVLAWLPVPTQFEFLRDEALACTSCKLAGLGRTQVVFGMGDPGADLVLVGEGPGAEEDKQGLPFVGRSGKLLDKLLIEEIGVTRDSCYIANVVKCRPPGNRDPEADEIETCRPYLERQLDLIDPKVVVTLGNFAAQLLLATKVGITKIRGQSFTFRTGVLIPTVHPAFALRGGGGPMAQMRADFIRAKLALGVSREELSSQARTVGPDLGPPRYKQNAGPLDAIDDGAGAEPDDPRSVPAASEAVPAGANGQPGLFD